MNEKVRKSIVFAVFIGALILAYIHFGNNGDEQSHLRPGRLQQPSASVGEPANASPALPAEIGQLHDTLPWGKNPFYHSYRPIRTTAPPKKIELHLLGVVYRQVNAQALINNTVVRQGDTIGGYIVEEIGRDHVRVSRGETSFVLRVEKERS